MSTYDAPNQQLVRPDGSGPGVDQFAPVPKDDGLDSMTKAQLIEYAAGLGVDVDETATKADIRAVIDQAEGR